MESLAKIFLRPPLRNGKDAPEPAAGEIFVTTIKAVTFDLWDTMIADETDEPKRSAQGLASKPKARIAAWTCTSR